MYYSGWYVPFPTGFAKTVANHGAVPLVQMDPDGINIAHIASGRYDGYLSYYAEAVRAYSHPVILSFGHEMNGNWSDWGYRHTSPAAFVAAWQHIVNLFRVTWCQERDLAVDRQHHQRLAQRQGRQQSEAVVARQFVCHLGGDRRLLPQAQLAVRSAVRADHCRGPRADQRPRFSSPRQARYPPPASQRRSMTCSPASAPMACSDSCGLTPRTPSARPSGSAVRRLSPRSRRAPARTTGLVHEPFRSRPRHGRGTTWG